MQERSPLPVTCLSGFLGAGKTTLLRRILEQNHVANGLRIAVIVNDMAELNIDAKLVRSVKHVEEKLVEMQNGCICCTLREDLLLELKKLAEEKRFDYILIESTGISEPQQVAETFAFEDENGVALNEWTRLDTLVTVVDCANFAQIIASTNTVQHTKEALDNEDQRLLSQLLIDQVEFANVIMLNKCDLVSQEHVESIAKQIAKLNPDAKIVQTTHSDVPVAQVMQTGLFDLEAAVMNPGWMQILRGQPIKSEKEEYGVSSFVYRRRAPFHPRRLYNLLEGDDPLPGVIRSKGFAWIANRNDDMITWSQAGSVFSLSCDDKWFASIPEDEWPDYLNPDALREDFEDPHGDRRQEIVIIGHHMDEDSISNILDGALVRAAEDWKVKDDPWAPILDDSDEFDDLESDSCSESEGHDSKKTHQGHVHHGKRAHPGHY